MKQKATIIAALVALGGMSAANASIITWWNQAQSTTGNVTADTTGWTFDGTAGVDYDFGALDALDGKPVDGSTVEFLFNFADVGTSISIGTVGGWSPGNEMNQLKLEQWNNTGKFGITLEGHTDYTLTTASVFDQDIHVVFRRNNDGGTIDLFVNGAFMETDTGKTNWRMDGGPGKLGSRSNGTTDVATGTMYGVASYDVALSNQQIADLYTAYTVPEPSALMLVGLGGLAFLVRRRK
jgi:hypothetical protein